MTVALSATIGLEILSSCLIGEGRIGCLRPGVLEAMVSHEPVYGRFQDVAYEVGSEVYLPIREGLRFVDACDVESLAVIGIEGMTIVGSSIQANLEAIADFSKVTASTWDEYRRSCSAEARAFIRQLGPWEHGFLCFVTTNEREWLQETLGEHPSKS
jgi:hypothetical protein